MRHGVPGGLSCLSSVLELTEEPVQKFIKQLRAEIRVIQTDVHAELLHPRDVCSQFLVTFH